MRSYRFHRNLCVMLFACGPIGAVAAAVLIGAALFTGYQTHELIVKSIAAAMIVTALAGFAHHCLILRHIPRPEPTPPIPTEPAHNGATAP